MELSHGLLVGPHDTAAGLPQGDWSMGEHSGGSDVFYDLASEVTLMLLQCSISYPGQPCSKWKEIHEVVVIGTQGLGRRASRLVSGEARTFIYST